MKGMLRQWLSILVCMMILLRTESFFVDITYVQSAVAKGAVCLDGSPPAYHMDKGSGAGINNWLVHIEGGGWCNNVTTCRARTKTRLGSSKEMVKQIAFSGIFSNKPQFNPDFYDWNRIKVRYCDGASFTGDVEAVDPATNLYFRGARVFVAIIEDLLANGMKSAQNGSAKNLPQSCTSKMKPGLCFFPQNVAQGIQTPLFLVNAAYDSWQIKNILAPGVADPHGTWHNCKTDITKCSTTQLQIMQAYRTQFLDALSGLGSSSSRGYFVNSCYAHCQTEMQETWLRSDSPVLSNKTIAKAAGDWFYERSPFQKIDCPYPCDKTCHNRIFDPQEHSY